MYILILCESQIEAFFLEKEIQHIITFVQNDPFSLKYNNQHLSAHFINKARLAKKIVGQYS